MILTKYQMEALNHCLKCSICVDSCPVARVNPGFPGPKQLGIDWLRLTQGNWELSKAAANYCSNCKTCETVCPSGVRVGALNQLVKATLPQEGLGLREIIFSDPAKLGKLMHIWPQAGNLVTGLSPVKFLTEKTVGISAGSPMPQYSTRTFRKLLDKYKPEYSQTPQEVLYFPGCYVQYNKPAIGISLIKILAKLNYKATVPDFKCCGQPAISNAHLKDTRKFAEANLRILRQHYKKGMPILFTCPSCLLTLKEEYKTILEMDEYAEFCSAMLDAGYFLRGLQEQLTPLILSKKEDNFKIAYHEPCHLRAAGQGTPGFYLLKQTAGFNIASLEAGCCGLAGSYGLKSEKHWIAEAIGKSIKDAVAASEPQAVATECGMCSVQINHLTRLPVYHPLELLAGLIAE